MILLPTMLREAFGRSSVGFQTVPGLSKFNKSVFPTAGTKKNHVAYLTDGDQGGRDIVKDLKKNKIEEKAIFRLSTGNQADCQFQDFVADEILVQALKNIILKFNPGKKPPNPDAIPETCKYKYLNEKFSKLLKKDLNKVDLAYEVVEIAQGGSAVLDARHKQSFLEVAAKIHKFLEVKE